MPADSWQLLWGFAAGLASGALYFGGLWLTVGQLAKTKRPYRLLLISFVLRMLAVLAVSYLLLFLGWGVLMMALAGLLLARQLWIRAKSGGKGNKWTSALMQPSSGSGESSSLTRQ